MRVNRLNPVQKATYLKKKLKVGTNEEYTVTESKCQSKSLSKTELSNPGHSWA